MPSNLGLLTSIDRPELKMVLWEHASAWAAYEIQREIRPTRTISESTIWV